MSKIKKIRKVLSVITAAALVSGGTGFTASVVSENTKASAAVAGDVNGDGSVNISDAVLLQKYLTKQGTLPKNASADINGDGKVNVFDLVSVKNTL